MTFFLFMLTLITLFTCRDIKNFTTDLLEYFHIFFFLKKFINTDRKLKAAKGAFDASIDCGITFFDTAEVYGAGVCAVCYSQYFFLTSYKIFWGSNLILIDFAFADHGSNQL